MAHTLTNMCCRSLISASISHTHTSIFSWNRNAQKLYGKLKVECATFDHKLSVHFSPEPPASLSTDCYLPFFWRNKYFPLFWAQKLPECGQRLLFGFACSPSSIRLDSSPISPIDLSLSFYFYSVDKSTRHQKTWTLVILCYDLPGTTVFPSFFVAHQPYTIQTRYTNITISTYHYYY
jgi:hypothetical protein